MVLSAADEGTVEAKCEEDVEWIERASSDATFVWMQHEPLYMVSDETSKQCYHGVFSGPGLLVGVIVAVSLEIDVSNVDCE